MTAAVEEKAAASDANGSPGGMLEDGISSVGDHHVPVGYEDPIVAVPASPDGMPEGVDHVLVADEGSGESAFTTAALDSAAVAVDSERDATEVEDFFDPQDSISMSSNTEADESGGPERSWKPSTPMGEYFDAFEEISSDGAMQSPLQNIEAELREMRLNLLMEIGKRKQAEEALDNLQTLWQMLSNQLSLVGLALPAAPSITEGKDGVSDVDDPAEELCRQVLVARFVAETIGRGCAKAEVELEMGPQVDSKNFEIARLGDRLQYYETANREMSQRNQEAVEMARQQRQRRKRRQKWVWRLVGLAIITLGGAAVAWSYDVPMSASASASSSKSHHSLEVVDRGEVANKVD